MVLKNPWIYRENECLTLENFISPCVHKMLKIVRGAGDAYVLHTSVAWLAAVEWEKRGRFFHTTCHLFIHFYFLFTFSTKKKKKTQTTLPRFRHRGYINDIIRNYGRKHSERLHTRRMTQYDDVVGRNDPGHGAYTIIIMLRVPIRTVGRWPAVSAPSARQMFCSF